MMPIQAAEELKDAGMNIYAAVLLVVCVGILWVVWKKDITMSDRQFEVAQQQREEEKVYQKAVLNSMQDIKEEVRVKFVSIEERHNRITHRVDILLQQQLELTQDVAETKTVLVDIGMWPLEVNKNGTLTLQPRPVRDSVFGEKTE